MPYEWSGDTDLSVLLANPNSVNFGTGYVPYVIDDRTQAAAIAQGADPSQVAEAAGRSREAVAAAQAQGLPAYADNVTQDIIKPQQVLMPGSGNLASSPVPSPAQIDADAIPQYSRNDIRDLIFMFSSRNVDISGYNPEFSNYDVADLIKYLRGG